MKHRIRKACAKVFALVLAIAGAQSALSQTFKLVKVKDGSGLAQIAAGGTSVWALALSGNPYVYQGGQFVLANSITLTQIAVGGGNAFQADTVWGLDSSGNIYKAAKTAGAWVFTQIPASLGMIVVGPGYQDKCRPYEVWGRTRDLVPQVFRYNFCGQNWDQVSGSLTDLALGGGDMWGLNYKGDVFRFNSSTGRLDQLPGTLTQLTVGPNGFWGLYMNQIYQFNNNIQNFSQLPGSLMQIQAGGDGVWGITSTLQVVRLEPASSSFVQIPGVFSAVSVGNGSGVWGIDRNRQPYRLSTP
jgi:hypothetical protein